MSEKIIQLNEEAVKGELKELVRKSVEETLNELLDKEADELTGASKYERSASRQGYRSGHYSRKLTTTSGEVRLEVPKLNDIPFETAIIERYRRRESSVEEALIEMYLTGVSMRRVEDISEALWGSLCQHPPSAISIRKHTCRETVHCPANIRMCTLMVSISSGTEAASLKMSVFLSRSALMKMDIVRSSVLPKE